MRIEGDAKLIAAAFVKARAAMNATVSKDAKGNYGKYATLAAIVEATAEHFAKAGLAIVQEPTMDELGLVIETWLVHESGATMQFSPLTMPLTDRKPQAVGSAITYGRRYALAAICGLAPDDDDGQAAQDAETRAKPHNRPKSSPVQVDNPFDDAPAKPEVASAEQLQELEALGADFYGDEWEEQRTKLAQAVSKGEVAELHYLLPKEATKLIEGIRKRMAEVNGAKAVAA